MIDPLGLGAGQEHPRDVGGGRSLADELEDGPLRRELGVPAPAPPPAPEPAAFEARLAFDGQGAEYFRIWVVHTALTLLTLGVYSAWAKVRKARWFAQHTRLMDDRFDYHGQPWRVLAGRLLAVGLLLLWTWSFDIAHWLGWLVLAAMLVVGPLLFAGAQRFRLANTSWRGLRFGFDAPPAQVYLVCVPLLVLWVFDRVLKALGLPNAWLVAASALVLLALPMAHARLKRMQHSHARFGAQAFSFEPATGAFYRLYGKAAGLLLVAGAGLMALYFFGLVVVFRVMPRADAPPAGIPVMAYVVPTVVTMLVLWLVVWPFFAARAQQLVWSRTRWGTVRFRGEMQSWALWKLTAVQTLLTLLTAGLYWPFAAVKIARYRIESLVVQADEPIRGIVATAPPQGARGAIGDAAADAFGLDLGW